MVNKADMKTTPNKDKKDGSVLNSPAGLVKKDPTPNKGDQAIRRGGSQNDGDRNKLGRGARGGSFNHGGRGGRGGSHNTPRQQRGQPNQQEAKSAGTEEGGDGEEAAVERRFTGRCRLFVGNLPNDTTDEEFKKMFEPYGESTEIFLNASRGFGFIRMDFRKNAEAAKQGLDGLQKKGRVLRVRFATHGAALRVKYLNPFVTNELLMSAFTMFGEVERAVVVVDDRGKPTGEGIVEFARKPGAQAALKRISEGVFMLTGSPRPIAVEPLEQKDEEDGLPEKFAQKSGDFIREREQPPRFATPGSFEFEFGQKWKDVYLMHEDGEKTLKRQFEEGLAKLEIEQAGAMMEHQTAMLRQDLLRRQEELRRLEEQHQMEMQRRLDMRRQDDDRRRQDDDQHRQQEMELRRQQEERRQQELYRQQERAMREMRGERGSGGNAPPMQPPPAPPAGLGLEQSRRGGMGNHGGQGGGNMDGHGMGGGNQGYQGGGGNNMAGNMPQMVTVCT